MPLQTKQRKEKKQIHEDQRLKDTSLLQAKLENSNAKNLRNQCRCKCHPAALCDRAPEGLLDRRWRNSAFQQHKSDICRRAGTPSAPEGHTDPHHCPQPPLTPCKKANPEIPPLEVTGRQEVRKNVPPSASYFPSALNYVPKIKTTSSTHELLSAIYYAVVFHNLQFNITLIFLCVCGMEKYTSKYFKNYFGAFFKKAWYFTFGFTAYEKSSHKRKHIFENIVKALYRVANTVLK